MREILVVGAGVSGLTSAIRLLEAGAHVRILAKARTPGTTSDVAAAVFFPYLARPVERVVAWSRRSLEVFEDLAHDPATGVRMTDALEPLDAPPTGPPWWDGIGAWRDARPDEVPAGYAAGRVLRAPVIEMPRYMRWLEARVEALGATLETRGLRTLEEAAREADVVLNCSGLGARELADDPGVRPVRGQIVRLENPGLARAILDQDGYLALGYVVPREDGVIAGGSADEDAWDLTPDPALEETILRKARLLAPQLRDARVLSRHVGLRPARDEVRLETQRVGDALVVHNYGHGGAGVTLSWGCAEEAAALVGAKT